MRKVLIVLHNIVLYFIMYIPGLLGKKIRYMYYKNKFKSCGQNVNIGVGVVLNGLKDITLGSNVCIDDYAHISAGKINGFRGKIRTKRNKYFNFEEGEVIVGSNVHIAHYGYINGHGGVCIMDSAGLGARATIYSITNLFNNPKDKSEMINMGNQTPQETQMLLSSPVVLMENSHLLYTSIAFPGVTMMKNSIVMPLSKVVSNIYENTIAEGNPAMKIDSRFEYGENN